MTTMVQRTGRELYILGIVGILALLGGVLSASGRLAFVAIFVGLVIALLVASSRVAVFWLVVVIALVATGLAQLYLPGSGARYVRYVAPVASFATASRSLSGPKMETRWPGHIRGRATTGGPCDSSQTSELLALSSSTLPCAAAATAIFGITGLALSFGAHCCVALR